MKWIIIILLLIVSISCSQDLEDISASGASLQCNISVGSSESQGAGSSSLKAASTTPPAYVTGIVLTAHNNEYGVADKTLDKNFGSTTPSSVTFTGLTVGSNTITAKGKCEGTAKNDYYTGITLESGDLNTRATNYASQLRTRQPIYVDYYSQNPVNVNISPSTVNAANISMVTENHRMAVAVENSSTNHVLKVEIQKKNDGATVIPPAENWVIGRNEVDGLIVNDENAKGNITYVVKIECFTYIDRGDYIETTGKVFTFNKEIIANAYDNITKLYHFNGSTIETGTAVFKNITWGNMDENNSSITVS